jgi:hypothetical protein
MTNKPPLKRKMRPALRHVGNREPQSMGRGIESKYRSVATLNE